MVSVVRMSAAISQARLTLAFARRLCALAYPAAVSNLGIDMERTPAISSTVNLASRSAALASNVLDVSQKGIVLPTVPLSHARAAEEYGGGVAGSALVPSRHMPSMLVPSLPVTSVLAAESYSQVAPPPSLLLPPPPLLLHGPIPTK